MHHVCALARHLHAEGVPDGDVTGPPARLQEVKLIASGCIRPCALRRHASGKPRLRTQRGAGDAHFWRLRQHALHRVAEVHRQIGWQMFPMHFVADDDARERQNAARELDSDRQEWPGYRYCSSESWAQRCGRLEQRDTQRPHIRARTVRFAVQHLWRHVRIRPSHRRALGRGCALACQPEIAQHGPTVARNQHVGGLDVTVRKRIRVHVRQPRRQIRRQLLQVVARPFACVLVRLHVRGQIAASRVLHGDVQVIIRVQPVVVHAHDVAVRRQLRNHVESAWQAEGARRPSCEHAHAHAHAHAQSARTTDSAFTSRITAGTAAALERFTTT